MSFDWDLGSIAHRGLHDISRGVVENSPGAVAAALDGGFGIEVDLQLASDDVAMVFHDFTLDRLIDVAGPVRAHTARALATMAYREGGDTIFALTDLLEAVDGAVPLYIELKSDWSGDMTLARTVARPVNAYRGPISLMSFDPGMMEVARTLCPRIPCGLVSGTYATRNWDPHAGGVMSRFALRHMLSAIRARPAFINYDISAIDGWAPQIARKCGLPLLTWTVRTSEEREMAARHADAMVFEGFVPDTNGS